MPIYEYQCSACNHQFDLIQKMSDEPIKTCPKCAEDKAVRLVSAAGFQLKGSGWYATDFKTTPKGDTSTEKVSTTDSKPTDATTKTEAPAPATPSVTRSDSK